MRQTKQQENADRDSCKTYEARKQETNLRSIEIEKENTDRERISIADCTYHSNVSVERRKTRAHVQSKTAHMQE